MAEIIRSPDTERKDRIPPGQHAVQTLPVLHYGDVPQIDTSRWTFTISGQVTRERVLSYDEFAALPRIKVHSDIHCVTTWSKLDALWEGPASSVIKELTAILPRAGFAIVHAEGGFTTNLTLADFFQGDVLFAMKLSGEPLTPEHGYPVRLVVPRLYFWKSAKWVTGVEFTERDKRGFWESMGYHNRGDPWREERYTR